jgi:hypothetical protein
MKLRLYFTIKTHLHNLLAIILVIRCFNSGILMLSIIRERIIKTLASFFRIPRAAYRTEQFHLMSNNFATVNILRHQQKFQLRFGIYSRFTNKMLLLFLERIRF